MTGRYIARDRSEGENMISPNGLETMKNGTSVPENPPLRIVLKIMDFTNIIFGSYGGSHLPLKLSFPKGIQWFCYSPVPGDEP